MDPFAGLQAREFLSNLGDLSQTQIFAKIENVEVRSLLEFFEWSQKKLHVNLNLKLYLVFIFLTFFCRG